MTVNRMKIFFHRLGVRISIFYLVVSMTIILVFSGVIYYMASNILVNEAVSKTSIAVQKSSDNIEAYIDRVKGVLQIFSENPMLQRYLSSENEVGSEKDSDSLARQVDSIKRSDDHIESIIAVARNGKILSNEKKVDMSLSKDMMNESWYINAINNDMPTLTSARMQSFAEAKDNWVISMSTEIKSPEGENLGVLLIDMKYCVIEDYIQDLDLGENGYIFIMNEKKELVYHKDPSNFSDKEKQKTLIKKLESKRGYDKQQNVLTYNAKIRNADWTMVGVLSLDNLKLLKKQLLDMVALTGILLFLAIILINILFTKRLSKPMDKLVKGMQEIENLAEIEIAKKNFYEFELLTDNYNKMIRKIKVLMIQLSQNERNLKQYEINALTSQINPHFLYNTLDTIVWMAEFNDSEKIISITKSLAAFFRLSLNGGRELVSIQDEIEHVKQYLYIQKERYEDKLNYSISIDEHLQGYLIPKIVLQPIVENSIYHGIKPRDGNGHIMILVKEEGDKVVIAVEDDGVGFQMEPEGRSGSERAKSGGVGIHNVDQRLKLYYGEECGIRVESGVGRGCTVSLIIGKEVELQ